MAYRLDVPGRLAEGRPAVERTESYVRACGDTAQIIDVYDSEDGLDLHALDADCARLRDAGTIASEALRMQRDQLSALTAAWTGPGADAAVAFLRRQCEAATTVATEVRAAAQRCESLRDNLWQLVDAKVATAIAIDDRTLGQRTAWLAAAAAVIHGVADRTAVDVVSQQVKPYVDNDIRKDWVIAMQSTRAGVTASYDMVSDRFAATPHVPFEIPGDLGPAGPPVRPVAASAPLAPGEPGPVAAASRAVEPVASLPAAAPALAAAAPATPNSSPIQPDWGTGSGGVPGLSGGGGNLGSGGLGSGDLGGGALGMGGGLGSLAGQIVSELGDLLGSATDDADDVEDLDEPDEPDGPGDLDERMPPKPAGPSGEVAMATTPPVGSPATELPVAGPPAGVPTTVTPPAGPPPAGPPPAGPPLPGASPAAATPCEIAANELPKAGQ